MKRRLLLLVVLIVFGASGLVSAQGNKKIPDKPRLYITSYYDVDVYRQYRKIGTLKRGMRAQVLKTTASWILVRYWANGQAVVGWIRK